MNEIVVGDGVLTISENHASNLSKIQNVQSFFIDGKTYKEFMFEDKERWKENLRWRASTNNETMIQEVRILLIKLVQQQRFKKELEC